MVTFVQATFALTSFVHIRNISTVTKSMAKVRSRQGQGRVKAGLRQCKGKVNASSRQGKGKVGVR